MKISIGMNLQSGPWGGGNQFGVALTNHLRTRGDEVCHDLKSRELDLILLAEPDRKLRSCAYDHRQILGYLLFTNPHALVVHRINNTSEARDDSQRLFNRFRIDANRVADHTVFVSDWAKNCYMQSGFPETRAHSVILNGADHHRWRSLSQSASMGKIRLVTHHWSNNKNKGFDVYQKLDQMLAKPPWSERLAFTFIGRLPDGFSFVNAQHLEPLSGAALVNELNQHDVYLTASRHEAGGNHNLEGALCGLPLLYMDSGSMSEYCTGYGIVYSVDNLAEKLEEMVNDYAQWQERMATFPHTAERMCKNYEYLFQKLLEQRHKITARRRWWRHPWWLARTLSYTNYGK